LVSEIPQISRRIQTSPNSPEALSDDIFTQPPHIKSQFWTYVLIGFIFFGCTYFTLGYLQVEPFTSSWPYRWIFPPHVKKEYEVSVVAEQMKASAVRRLEKQKGLFECYNEPEGLKKSTIEEYLHESFRHIKDAEIISKAEDRAIKSLYTDPEIYHMKQSDLFISRIATYPWTCSIKMKIWELWVPLTCIILVTVLILVYILNNRKAKREQQLISESVLKIQKQLSLAKQKGQKKNVLFLFPI